MNKVTCSVVVNAHLSQLQDHLKWTGAVRHQQLPPPEHLCVLCVCVCVCV